MYEVYAEHKSSTQNSTLRLYSRERERVNNSYAGDSVASEHVSSKVGLAFFVICLAFVGTILAIGFQNIATATPEQVNFNPVTIRNGAKIHVNGDKTLTAIDNGNKLFADNSAGRFVTNNNINKNLAGFSEKNYGNDELFNNNITGEASLPSASSIEKYRGYLPFVSRPYWLDEYEEKEIYAYRSYANENNTFDYNRLSISGKNNDYEYDDTVVATGPYAFAKDIWGLYNYTKLTGGDFTFSGGKLLMLQRYIGRNPWLDTRARIYNNPYLLSSGQIDGRELGYTTWTSSTGKGLINAYAVGFINKDKGNRLERISEGQYIPKGTTVAIVESAYTTGFWEDRSIFSTPDMGDIILDFQWSQDIMKFCYLGFVEASEGFVACEPDRKPSGDLSIGAAYYPKVLVSYFKDNSSYRRNDKEVVATKYIESSKDIRPVYEINRSDISFIRDSASDDSLVTSSALSYVPKSTSYIDNGNKLVVKSDSVKIDSKIDESKLVTEKNLNGHAETKFNNNIIKVPWGAKTLTVKSSALQTENANYISALSYSDGQKKYGVIGKVGEDLNIDLSGIVNVNELGSSATVSFYAEQANGENTSDAICRVPVTVNIEVVEGPEQTIKYDLGGGSGSKPENVVVRAGKIHNLADGSGLNKEGNLFSRWQVTYTKFGETDPTTIMIKGNEPIVVPDTVDGVITATALYSGFKSFKSTDSEPTVYTVTWDTNSPDGFSSTFAASDTGTFNDSRTQRYDKVKDLAVNSVPVPSGPEVNTASRIFDGWYTERTGGEKVEVSVNVTKNVTYYAHWFEGFKVTYDATGGEGSDAVGHFTNGSTLATETVLPNSKLEGPRIDGDIAEPTLNSEFSEYVFVGWYTGINGKGTKIEFGESFVVEEMTCYAYYVSKTFFAPTSAISNPRDIVGTKYALSYVASAARDIFNKGESSSYFKKFDSYMRNDSYHLYSLLKDSDGNWMDANDANSWSEFRIIHVGKHDNDGSGITFQANHIFPSQSFTSLSYERTWESSVAKKQLSKGGEIFEMIDENLTSSVVNLPSGKLTLLSLSELTGQVTSSSMENSVSKDGSQYTYWSLKGATGGFSANGSVWDWNASSNTNLVFKLRDGKDKTSGGFVFDLNYWSLRSLSSGGSWRIYRFLVDGNGEIIDTPTDQTAGDTYKGWAVPVFAL